MPARNRTARANSVALAKIRTDLALQSQRRPAWPLMFQSTLPAWGATSSPRKTQSPFTSFNPRSPRGERRTTELQQNGITRVSIHAPRVGSDHRSLHSPPHPRSFNPRSPRGERLETVRSKAQSAAVSIHAPRVGSDARGGVARLWPCCFNPRSPRGERRSSSSAAKHFGRFQSTLPAWGATSKCFSIM